MLRRSHVVLLRYLLLERRLRILGGRWREIKVTLRKVARLSRINFLLAGDGQLIEVANFIGVFDCGTFLFVCSDADLRLEELSPFWFEIKRVLRVLILELPSGGSMLRILWRGLREGKLLLLYSEVLVRSLLHKILLVLSLGNLTKESYSLLLDNGDLMSFCCVVVAESTHKAPDLCRGLLYFS